MNLFSLLDQAAARHPDRGAVFRGTEAVHSFAGLRSRALRLAAGLRAAGEPGDRIAIATENVPEYVELFFGVWAAGMAATPVNAKLHARELVQILEDSGASTVFVSPKLASGLEETLVGSPAASCRRIVIGGADYAALAAGDEWTGPIDPDPQALGWLFYTSGTTGRSKGAMLSHRNLLAMTIAHLADVETVDEECSLLHAAPMSHGSGLYMAAYVGRGARQVVPASSAFEPAEFLDLCDHHPGCGAFLAPTMVQRLRLEAERTGRRPANLRSVVYGGGPMYVEELRRSLAAFGPVFVQIYGQGEAPMTITCLRRRDHADDEAVLGSVGFARSGVEVAVVDAGGRPLPQGEVGEIVCRGDVVMAGYWNNAGATADVLRGGWLFTGDMGSFDARGYLTLRDRSKDVIISGGTNVYPREVEEVLLRHPDVAEVCVTGQPDPEWGEIVVAFIVAEAGRDTSPASLDDHCNANIARFKRPKRYLFVDGLPKNNYGKVLKRELRERLVAGA
ncbi:AMP-binding protein [Azospirillum sp. YIM B02556]|uniref:AMP-binding protein n=1 Tax=Azospirillum endophyticum TaxID=2800326 RepID=A0ABS1FGL6_9PROT|nr:AMP-binding protein [Azospirillum endophyticum]